MTDRTGAVFFFPREDRCPLYRSRSPAALRGMGRRRPGPPRNIWLRAGEIGILGTSICPEAYGGLGADFLYDAIVLEELGRFGVRQGGPRLGDMHSYIIASFLTHFGTQWEQLCRVAPEDGRWIADRLDRPHRTGRRQRPQGIAHLGKARGRRLCRQRRQRPSSPTATIGPTTSCWPPRPIRMRRAPRASACCGSISTRPGVSRGRNLKKIGNKAQDTAELSLRQCRGAGRQPDRRRE